ncbi:MAG: carbohydrate porin, partial [Succinivibrionaceae bacterium]|nr:carbohydrate porin [Succinivibrionaceae bacterium]
IMKAKWLPLSAVVALALSSAAASAVDFHGYFRAGMQANARGGEVYCLGNGNAGHKVGRLADECDTYAEIALSQEVYNKAGSKFTVNTLIAYGTYEASDDYEDAQQDYQGNSWQGTGGAQSRADTHSNPWGGQRISARELWAGYQTDAGYQIWAGKRFYQRKDVHILDLYYLNNSGYGAGIENIALGKLGSASFAVTKWSNDGSIVPKQDWDKSVHGLNRHVYKLDARWNGIPVGFGTVDAAVIYALPFISDYQKEKLPGNSRATQANSGVLVTLDHASTVNTDNVSLMNHFVVQYGTNGFAYVGQFKNHAGDNYTPDGDAQGVRVIDWGTFDAGNFGLGYSLLWGHLNSGDDHGANGNNAWTYTRDGWEYSIVLRPEYKWTEYTRTTLELGYTKMKATGWVAQTESGSTDGFDPDAYKITLAQQFTPGKGFWSRPAIRFYVSYIGGDQLAHQNNFHTSDDGSWQAGRLFREANKDHNYQISFGTQVEAWW